ncbi:nickel-responsive transcriptional regulator NikR [Flavobacterium sp.]|jgi:CopG family nickel-responsive transcriptional regulator|uniref:nickel-responsive transcriptional regulator NikR n=1 Tax=Flavobacterium sp. TaxID=239 RepID=UPI0037BEBA80
MSLVRFGVSIEEELLHDLDNYVLKNKFPNRSQAIRQIIAELSVKNKISQNEIVAGVITISYNHHKSAILQKINDTQHDYLSVILSSMHFHIDHHQCMEIIAVKGFAYLIQELADKLISIKGIDHGNLAFSK